MSTQIETNATMLEAEMVWMKTVMEGKIADNLSAGDFPAPDLTGTNSAYADLVRRYNFNLQERLVLTLALVPHFKPHLLDIFFQKDGSGRPFTFVGGIVGKRFRGFMPTGETAMYALAGTDLAKRFFYSPLFGDTHAFATDNLLRVGPVEDGEPALSGELIASGELLYFLSQGRERTPQFSAAFPAEALSTPLDWEDLVLNRDTTKEIEELTTWITHHATLMNDWGMQKKLKKGYRALFYGPPGTGKSLTAALIGKHTGMPVYRIDLSGVISKYIGETEKNLAGIFNRAEHKNWILFFDEADALFGKRTNVHDAHDRYANQEVSYLLQRVENYNGLVILASNMKNNLDQAFMRRFQSVVYFPMPKPEERIMLWQNGFSASTSLEQKINLLQIAENYELAGGSIINVVQYSSLMALKKNTTQIALTDLIDGIRKEYHKIGKTL